MFTIWTRLLVGMRVSGPVVFVNYQVRNQSAHASLLHGELSRRFGQRFAFLASSSIAPGADFVDAVFANLWRCRVLLALIGKDWLDHLGEAGADGWVRRELAEAFQQGIRVIPVLIDGVELPGQGVLPTDIAQLARCQPLHLRHYSMTSDLEALARELQRFVRRPRPIGGSGGAEPLRLGVWGLGPQKTPERTSPRSPRTHVP
jgi:hypothetical protein